jgi:hypothetical protein
MRKELFHPTSDAEARLLLLIAAFTGVGRSLEGRVKLAKLDFFLRYPKFLRRALQIRGASGDIAEVDAPDNIEARMVRYRYGPWDPSYYAVLGRLIGKRLVAIVPIRSGLGFRVTDSGQAVASRLAKADPWRPTAKMIRLLKRHLDLSGTNLKDFIYQHFPEVSNAEWGTKL